LRATVNASRGDERKLRHAAPIGLPLRDNARVLRAALLRAVFAEQNIAPAAKIIGERDNGLAVLLVLAIRGDGSWSAHAVGPF
jgi:hypothetical protein